MAEVNVTKATNIPAGTPRPMAPAFGFPLLGGGFLPFMNPFTGFKRFSDEMERMFNREVTVFGDTTWSPAIEVKRKNGNFCVTAEIPGVKTEDVKVHIENKALVLEGKREEEKTEKREGFYHSERFYGNFCRTIPLPEGAETNKTTAEFHNGVLEVNIPAPEPTPAKKEIPVHVV